MTDTITGTVSGALTFTTIVGYSATAEDRSIVHPILGASTSDIVERPAGLRRGTIELLHETASAAFAAFAALRTPQTFTLESTDIPAVDMDFKRADGDPEIELDPDTRRAWIVRCPWIEVAS